MPAVTSEQGDWFYHESDTLTGSFALVDMKIHASHFKLKAVAADLEFSWDGSKVSGKLAVADGFQTFESLDKAKIWLRGAGAKAILMAWE